MKRLLSFLFFFALIAGASTAQQTTRLGNVVVTGSAAFQGTLDLPANSLSISDTSGLQAALDGKRALSSYLVDFVQADPTSPLSGPTTADGQSAVAGDIVLLVGQATPSQNGPWVVSSGAWARPTWYPAGGTVHAFYGATVTVRRGDNYGGNSWRITSPTTAVTIGTTATVWAPNQATNGSSVPVYAYTDYFAAANLQDFSNQVSDNIDSLYGEIANRPTYTEFAQRIAGLSQGLIFDGTVGAAVGGTGWGPFGTGDFSFVFWSFRNTNYSPVADSSGTGQRLAIEIQDISGVRLYNGAVILPSGFTSSQGVWEMWGIKRVAGVVTASKNGGPFSGAVACTTNFTDPLIYFGRLYSGAQASGVFVQPLAYNYGLTDTKIARLFAAGTADIIDRGGSMTALNTTASWYAATGGTITVNTASAVTFSATSAGYAAFPVGAGRGKRYRMTVTHAGVSAGVFALTVLEYSPNYGSNPVVVSLPATAGTYSMDYTSLSGSTALEFRIQNSAAVSSTAFTNISIIPLGTLARYDSQHSGIGYQLHDSNGTYPPADIIRPGGGVEWRLPATTGTETVRGRLSWSGTHEAKSLLGQIALSPESVIRSITIKASASSTGSGVTIGTTNSATRYVAATTYTTAKKALTLANTLPAASAAGDLDLVIDPDTSNYTGTIDVSVTYDLTTGNP